jgi:hypothetical protein
MANSPQSQPSTEPNDRAKKSVAQENTEKFLQKLFAQAPHFEASFRKICELGCPSEEFGQRLWATCMLISQGSIPLLHGGSLSKAQLRSLPKRMRALGAIIGALNNTPLAPGNEFSLLPNDPERKVGREYIAQRYKLLPGVLYVYAEHLERFERTGRNRFKRLTSAHLLALMMLWFAETHTGARGMQTLPSLWNRDVSSRERRMVTRRASSQRMGSRNCTSAGGTTCQTLGCD